MGRMAMRTQVKPRELRRAFGLCQPPSPERNLASMSRRDASLVVSKTYLIRVRYVSGAINKRLRQPVTLMTSSLNVHGANDKLVMAS